MDYTQALSNLVIDPNFLAGYFQMFQPTPEAPKTREELLTASEDRVMEKLSTMDELEKRIMYQALYNEGIRITDNHTRLTQALSKEWNKVKSTP